MLRNGTPYTPESFENTIFSPLTAVTNTPLTVSPVLLDGLLLLLLLPVNWATMVGCTCTVTSPSGSTLRR